MQRRALLLSALAMPAFAQRFPDRPVRMLIPFAAGGPADLLGRIFADSFGQALGGTVVVEPRPGAGGGTALEAAARAAPDGHTLVLAGAGGLSVVPFLGPMPIDVLRDLAHITLVARVVQAIAVHPASGITDVASLVATMRARPGGGTYGSAGVGSTTHLGAAMLAREAGFEATHVPYRGIAPALTDLIGRRVDFVIADLPALRGQVDAGALRLIALTTSARTPALPPIPTTAELGLPRVNSDNWYSLAAPATLPASLRDTITQAAATALRDPRVVSEFARNGALAAPLSAEQTVDFIRSEQAKWAPLVRETGAAQN